MRLKTLYIVLLISWGTWSQEINLPTQTQYLADNAFVISPTYAGIGDYVKIRLNGLTQWVGIKDAPDTQSLAADMRLGQRSGVGFLLYNDSNGNTKQYGARASFAHHLTLDGTDEQYLSFGISYNYNHFKIDINNFDPNNPDPAVTDNRGLVNHNFDVGVLYRFKDFYFNFTASNILNKDIDQFDVNEPDKLRNYFFYSGYRFNGGSKDIEFEPSVYVQLYESDWRSNTDFNFKVRKYTKHEDYIWAGISYRFLNDQFLDPLNIGPMAGFKKSNFYFGYSYQITMNELINYNSGTHMITVGVDLFQGVSNCGCTH